MKYYKHKRKPLIDTAEIRRSVHQLQSKIHRLKKNEKRYEEALQQYTPEEIFLLYGDYRNWNKHSRRYSGTGKKYTGITVKDVGTHKKDNGTASQK